MEVCCWFTSIVDGPCSFRIAGRTRSREIVPLLSCTKNVDQHKSCYGFQDVGNEVQLIHVFNARKHQGDDDLGLSVEKHLSQKTLIGPGKLLGLSKNGPQGL